MQDISEKDWKLFRRKLPEWQKNRINRLFQEYKELIDSDMEEGEKFYQLKNRINSDCKTPGVSVRLSRKDSPFTVAQLIYDGAITRDDIKEFSDDFKEVVELYLR
ncbi:MAG: multidrug transporter [Erysipelotrichaceae bacterium]